MKRRMEPWCRYRPLYEGYLRSLMECTGDHESMNIHMPIWLVNTRRTHKWMSLLYEDMSHCNGYTLARQIRFRIEHAPEIRFERCEILPDEMREMLNAFCDILRTLKDEVFSHFESGKSITLRSKEDRLMWDSTLKKLSLLLDPQHDKNQYEKYINDPSGPMSWIPCDHVTH